ILGIIIGLGLMNKISVLWLSFGLFLGLIISPLRKSLRTKWPWIAGVCAFLVFLPHLIWQVVHDWPTLEFIKNATSQKMAAISPLDFLIDQIITMHPITLPIWICGILYYFFYRDGRKYQILGIIYIVVLLLLIINQKSRPGYLAPAYTMLFASGAIVFERFFERLKWKWLKPTFLIVVVMTGIITAPLALPVLPVENYINYAKYLGQAPSTDENKEVGKLPQHYADMFGWEKMVATIAKVYQGLTEEEKTQAVIFAGNYGEAGAIDFFGKKYNLPKAISGHNNYWLWGPGERSGEVAIFFGGPSAETLKNLFEEVNEAAIFTCEYCMPYENNTPVYLCKKPRVNINMVWPKVKHYE
ncbi:MAG: glycosyltransferase family 39 protein, partial [Candidatus Aminicenantes bacterium]|nr:glycosyltransferase family 39 protein [Candidatus Aminicenantes bacterium]